MGHVKKIAPYAVDLIRFAIVANTLWLIPWKSAAGFANYPSSLFDPLFLFSFFSHFPLPTTGLIAMTVIGAALTVAGLFNPLGPLLAFFSAAFFFGWPFNFGFFHWSHAIIPMSFATLALCGFHGPLSLARHRGGRDELIIHLTAMRFIAVFPFFAAGISKLRNTGLSWGSKENILTIFEYNRALFPQWVADNDLNKWLMAHPPILSVFAYFVLAAELASPLAFFRRALRFILPILILLYVAFTIAFGHNFLKAWWPLFLYWLPWEDWSPLTSSKSASDNRA